jgi:hypothetical protein
MAGPYSMKANPRGGYDVVRSAPTVVAEGLKYIEAEALAYAMNAQNACLEGKPLVPPWPVGGFPTDNVKLDLRGWPDHLPPTD